MQQNDSAGIGYTCLGVAGRVDEPQPRAPDLAVILLAPPLHLLVY